jgi:hypothetical protein
MHVLKALALAYDPAQDRVLTVVNPGALDSWAFWLTRRLALALLERLPATLEGTSAMAKQAPAEYRNDLVAFERDAALATTSKAMTRTDDSVMRNNAGAAELAVTVKISDQGNSFRLELHGERGGQAAGILGRAELQRILQMVHDEAMKASWLGVPAKPPELIEAQASAAKPIRH